MASILDIIGGAGSAIGDAASGVGNAIGDAGSALQNMASEAVGAVKPAISGAGDWLMGSGEYGAPEAAMRRQAQLNMLMKLGGTLMAAGANQSADSRAKQLARIGDVGTGYTSDLFKQQQARLMAAQLKQRMSKINALKSLDLMRKTDEGAAKIAKQTGLDPSVVKSLPVEQLSDLQSKIAVRLAVQRSQAAQMAQIMAPIIGGGTTPPSGVAPGAVPTPTQVDGTTPPSGVTPEAPAASPTTAITIPTIAERAARNAALTKALQRAIIANNPNAANSIIKMMEQKSPYATEGQKEEDKQFAKENVKWVRTGAAAAKSDLENLEFARRSLQNSLKTGKPLTGSAWLLLANAAGITGVTNPDTKAVMDAVLAVAQKSLKQILGGQFAAKEGEEFLKRAFDPTLTVQENLRRINILMSNIKRVADAKSAANAHFKKYGTMAQFRGERFSSREVLDTLRKQFADNTGGPPNSSGGAKTIDYENLK